MASRPTLFIRLLQACIHRVWTALVFLTVFSLATLTNHWWDRIQALCHAVLAWVQSLIG